ncbi:putative DNA binding domain-containing protein [Candidatus Sumerlaeota bacterium]|nr:putative DNA binding domain-containing protein [Candidatus Sumerlaeota bacterium]
MPVEVDLPPEKCRLLDQLRALPAETEWVEFKHDYFEPTATGQYLCAMANSARLCGKPNGFLVFGIKDGTHEVVGTKLRPRTERVDNGPLENWLAHNLEPRIGFEIHEGLYQGKYVVLFVVDPAPERPVEFKREAWVRVGSAKKKLREHPEKERKLWGMRDDWSAQVCTRATYDHLDPEAMAKARMLFKGKNPRLAAEMDGWDDEKFLTKAKVAIEGELTNTAILLLGKEEAEPLLQPAVVWLRWSLKKADGGDENYEDFRTPVLLAVDRLFSKVRNLKVRYLPDGTLFPVETDQYDAWVIREALHNAIAHQDYATKGRVLVVENPDELVFSNLGDFIPGSVEHVIREDVPPRLYRNPFLCQAMVSLGMIDTQGGGIRRMFVEQKKRCFPMPKFDLTRAGEVRVRVPGKLFDARYTRLLIENPDLELETAILLDRVQRGQNLFRKQYDLLKKQKLVEGRWGAYHVAAKVAATVDAKSDYIKSRGLDSTYYEGLVTEYLKKFGHASRQDIDRLLLDKLPDVLDEKQKQHKIHNLLSALRRADKVRNEGSRGAPRWILGSLLDREAKPK